ncbi:hypothetical protein JCM10049v2_001587 [Rhodotorula toruloides]
MLRQTSGTMLLARRAMPAPTMACVAQRTFSPLRSLSTAQRPATQVRVTPPDPAIESTLIKGQHLTPSVTEKVQTFPFNIRPALARYSSKKAAIAVIRPRSVARRAVEWLLSKVLSPHWFAPYVKNLAFKPVLLPVWFFDLSAKGRVAAGSNSFEVSYLLSNKAVPGCDLPPLSNVDITAFSNIPSVPHDPAKRTTAFGDAVEVLPFTRHPLNIPQKLQKLRTITNGNVEFAPSRLDLQTWATYPVYIPIYLGEWEVARGYGGRDLERVTTATYAASGTLSHPLVYGRKMGKGSPSWFKRLLFRGYQQIAPEGPVRPENIVFHFSRSDLTRYTAEKLLRNAVDQLRKELEEKGGGWKVWTDEMPGQVDDFAAKHDRVMSYSLWSQINQAYIHALHGYTEERLKLNYARSINPSSTTIQDQASGGKAQLSEVLNRLNASVDQWRRLANLTPVWLKPTIEKEAPMIKIQDATTSAKVRGRPVNLAKRP